MGLTRGRGARRSARDDSALAVDTHGHTDVAMALSRLLGFDLCPRLTALSDRHLFLPRGSEVPEPRAIVRTRIDPQKIAAAWDRIVHLAASVHSGHASAAEALVQLGPLLRPVFVADYFINERFRRELLRVFNRTQARRPRSSLDRLTPSHVYFQPVSLAATSHTARLHSAG